MENPILLIKTSEKVLIWLHRENKTQQWLASELKVTRQAISQKIGDNMFTASDITKIKILGCKL